MSRAEWGAMVAKVLGQRLDRIDYWRPDPDQDACDPVYPWVFWSRGPLRRTGWGPKHRKPGEPCGLSRVRPARHRRPGEPT